MGNPGAFSYSHPLWVKGFLDALGSPHSYTASSQDVSNRFAASAFLYGSPFIVPIPDLARTDFLLVIGANPLVSHGSVLSAPRIKDQLHAITDRGGRVVVVDPRRSETARAFEHLAIDPDGDAWMLLSILEVIFGEGLEDRGAIERQASGAAQLRRLAGEFPPEATEARSGVPARAVRALARDLAAADHAAVYGRTGSCLGRNGTLVAFLIDALNVVTGNLDREGGAMFGDPPIDFSRVADLAGLGNLRRSALASRRPARGARLAAGLGDGEGDDHAGQGPDPGDVLLRRQPGALACLTATSSRRRSRALELSVAIDLYVTDTSRHCDFVLPATTMYEREDLPLPFLALFNTPFIQMTEAVVEPRGEARQEWEVIDELSRRIGVVPSSVWAARLLGKLGVRLPPRRLVDLLLRAGPKGDLFGLRRGGLSLEKLRANPHGIVLAEHLAPGVARASRSATRASGSASTRRRSCSRTRRLTRRETATIPDFPLRLIGLRELRSHNSWMHNAPLLDARRAHPRRPRPP